MAKSTKALLTGRIQMCKTNPSIAHIGLATHGRSIQIGSSKVIILMQLSSIFRYQRGECTAFRIRRCK